MLSDPGSILRRTTDKGFTLPRVIIETLERRVLDGPVFVVTARSFIDDVRELFKILQHSLGIVMCCWIRLGSWVTRYPEVMRLAEECRKAILLRSILPEGNAVDVSLGKLRANSAKDVAVGNSREPMITIK